MSSPVSSYTSLFRLSCNEQCASTPPPGAHQTAVARDAFKALQAPIEMVTAPHTPVPFSPALEDLYIPSAERIAAAARKTLAA